MTRINQNNCERIFCWSAEGRALFYIELLFFDEAQELLFTCSLDYNILNHENISILINQTKQLGITKEQRDTLINSLFQAIQLLPGIKEYYFPDELIQKDGNYMEYYNNVLNELLFNTDFPDYTTFSKTSNTFFFNIIKRKLEKEIYNEPPVKVCKTDFEKLVGLSKVLQMEYVEHLSPEATFFYIQKKDRNGFIDIYIMAECDKIIMFFIRNSP